jgi:hypothetical protein
MLSIMQIDGLGKRYGMLPSQVLAKADTFDLYILDAALTFDQYHHKKALNGGREPMPDYTQNELLDILNKAKNTNA